MYQLLRKECPKWLFEKKVQQIKVERGISFADARKIATSENRAVPTPRGQPMAVVVRSGGGHQCPATRTIHTQTNLTWPRDFKDTYRDFFYQCIITQHVTRRLILYQKVILMSVLLLRSNILFRSSRQSQATVRRDKFPSNHPEGLGRPLGLLTVKVEKHMPQNSTALQRTAA